MYKRILEEVIGIEAVVDRKEKGIFRQKQKVPSYQSGKGREEFLGLLALWQRVQSVRMNNLKALQNYFWINQTNQGMSRFKDPNKQSISLQAFTILTIKQEESPLQRLPSVSFRLEKEKRREKKKKKRRKIIVNCSVFLYF